MQGGWFRLHRELRDKPIWKSSTPEQKVILMTLLMKANYRPSREEFRGEIITVQPGQMITSLEGICKTAGKGISIQNVRTALNRFKKFEFLTDEPTNKNRLITIINWQYYQSDDDQANTLTHKQLTGNQQAANNDKEYKNIRKKKDSSLRSESPVNSADADSPGPSREYPPSLVKFVEGFAAFVSQEHGAKAPKVTPALIANSLDIVDRLVRIDGHELETVKSVMRWAVRDSFWAVNALSLAGLRKKADGLTKFQKILAAFEMAQARADGGGDGSARRGGTQLEELARRRMERLARQREGGAAHAQ